jgi:hypothetical protein
MRIPKVTEIPPKPERLDQDVFVTDTHQLWPAPDKGEARDRDSGPERPER